LGFLARGVCGVGVVVEDRWAGKDRVDWYLCTAEVALWGYVDGDMVGWRVCHVDSRAALDSRRGMRLMRESLARW
jgi:hypothetical protein